MERTPEPRVTLEIEIRPAGVLQKEAGKRLFNKLLARAQSSLQTSNESEQINKRDKR